MPLHNPQDAPPGSTLDVDPLYRRRLAAIAQPEALQPGMAGVTPMLSAGAGGTVPGAWSMAPPALNLKRAYVPVPEAPKRDRLREALSVAAAGAGGLAAVLGAPALGAGLAVGGREAGQALDRDYELHQQGYLQALRDLGQAEVEASNQEAMARYNAQMAGYEQQLRDRSQEAGDARRHAYTLDEKGRQHTYDMEEQAARVEAERKLKEFTNSLPLSPADRERLELELSGALERIHAQGAEARATARQEHALDREDDYAAAPGETAAGIDQEIGALEGMLRDGVESQNAFGDPVKRSLTPNERKVAMTQISTLRRRRAGVQAAQQKQVEGRRQHYMQQGYGDMTDQDLQDAGRRYKAGQLSYDDYKEIVEGYAYAKGLAQ